MGQFSVLTANIPSRWIRAPSARRRRRPSPAAALQRGGVESVLVLLCCCQLFGIIALVNGAQVSGHYQRGDYQKALESSEAAKKWCIMGALLGPIATVILIGLQIMAEMR